MKNPIKFGTKLALLVCASMLLTLTTFGQTQISMPKNKKKIEEDLKIGRQAAAEVERQMPMLNDPASMRYIQDVGDRLAAAVPPQYQRPEFRCTFKIVNARDINAFALPGCFLYVNRGMIEAAKNEGEMAGVMAHEISHAMLRHGTADGPGLWTQVGALGALLGGAIVGAPELGQVAAAGLITPYSRTFERQSDLLGAQIMARAGYDPRDLANMFRTIGGEGQAPPEWISTHPNPGNRYNDINNEASRLQVSPNPIKITPGFQRVRQYLASLPRAMTLEEIEKAGKGQQGGGQSPTAGGQYQRNVPFPSTQTRTYNAGNVLSARIPGNWREFPVQSDNEVWFAPEGAYGNEGITHGVVIGVMKGTGNFRQDSQNYINAILQGNSYLRQQGGFSSGRISGRNALAATLSGTSPITRRAERDIIYTVQLANGSLLYVVTVAPQDQSSSYDPAFRNLINSIRVNDR